MIDSDPGLISAVEEVYWNSNLKFYSWHTENNIKNHLYGTKKSKFYQYIFYLNILELQSVTDEISGKDLYEIAKKLPYKLRREEFERKFLALKQNLGKIQLDYFNKLYHKNCFGQELTTKKKV